MNRTHQTRRVQALASAALAALLLGGCNVPGQPTAQLDDPRQAEPGEVPDLPALPSDGFAPATAE